MGESENSVQKKIKQLASHYGYHVSDTSQGYRPGGRRHGTTRITRGFPDLFMMNPQTRDHLFVEVKKEGGSLSDHQIIWHETALLAGVPCYTCDSASSFRSIIERRRIPDAGGE